MSLQSANAWCSTPGLVWDHAAVGLAAASRPVYTDALSLSIYIYINHYIHTYIYIYVCVASRPVYTDTLSLSMCVCVCVCGSVCLLTSQPAWQRSLSKTCLPVHGYSSLCSSDPHIIGALLYEYWKDVQDSRL